MENIKTPYFTATAASTIPDLIPDGVKFINAPYFWPKGSKGENRVIAIIDTGCDITHPDLADRILKVRNFTTDDNSAIDKVTDYVGHGTHVAGIIAANENQSGIIGVAPKAKLLILKALSKNGGSYDAVVQAVNYATSQKVDVINMSLGGPTAYGPLETAIKNAIANNISVVCAAGNEGDGRSDSIEISYPASYVNAISVGAMTVSRSASIFTDSNYTVDLLAPGENLSGQGIYSTAPGGKYVLMRGTSMAAPHVAGAIALIKNWAKDSFKRELTEEEIYAQLIKMTQSLGLPKSLEGNGMLFLMDH